MKRNDRLYVDIHVLQTVPPSCINRDDTGSPKTAVYGGVTRLRVSSQSWKRAARMMMRDETMLDQDDFGSRTKSLAQEIAKALCSLETSISTDEAEKLATDTVNLASGKPIISVKAAKGKAAKPDVEDAQDEEAKNEALFFVTPRQVLSVAKLALAWRQENLKPSKKEVQDALSLKTGIDIALFGRMVAQAPELNIDACVQVAHGISTHKAATEYDYFTAVDDLPTNETAGAAHIGTVEFSSATLYRYATVAVHELRTQLGGIAAAATVEFVRAFVLSMPTGKQNTFANRTLPDALMITVRNDQPVNLVGAFEQPVTTESGGYAGASVARLTEHAQSLYEDFAGDPLLILTCGKALCAVGEHGSFPDLIDHLTKALEAHMGKGDDE